MPGAFGSGLARVAYAANITPHPPPRRTTHDQAFMIILVSVELSQRHSLHCQDRIRVHRIRRSQKDGFGGRSRHVNRISLVRPRLSMTDFSSGSSTGLKAGANPTRARDGPVFHRGGRRPLPN